MNDELDLCYRIKVIMSPRATICVLRISVAAAMMRTTALSLILVISSIICDSFAKKNNLTLYFHPPSPPCRTVMMTGKVLGLTFNIKNVNISRGEQMKPEFMKVNPLHTVPVLDDDGFTLSESRAIAAYLVNQYGSDDSLYPKEPMKKALVDQRLYFDMGTLYYRFNDLYVPALFKGASLDGEKMEKLDEAFNILELYLGMNEWVAGNKFTIADISLHSSVSTAEASGYNLGKYPKVMKWFEKGKALIPNYDEAQKGLESFRKAREGLPKN